MDPVSAFGLAGTILQCIDCGSRFVKLAQELYRAEADSPNHLSELEVLTRSFSDVLATFKSSERNPVSAENQHNGLVQLADECERVAGQLLKLLRELDTAGLSRKRDALKRAFQVIWRKDEVEALKSRLADFRNAQHAMQNFSKQEETLRVLGVASQTSSRLEGIATSILNFIASKATSDLSAVIITRRSLHNDLAARIRQEGVVSVNTTAQLISLTPKQRVKIQKAVLSTLNYPGLEDRECRIAKTYKSTFEWILRDSNSESRTWHNFRKWAGREDQIYWVTGKAGSGKSTLMKYLCQLIQSEMGSSSSESDPDQIPKLPLRRCQPLLSKWAGEKKLFVASFYFWNSGTHLQMDRTGLLRSLLYQILRENPELVPIAFPSLWECLCILGLETATWTESDLQPTLESIIKALTTKSRICFFIDGLDEFARNHDDLISLIQRLTAQSKNVKFCVASRPWVIFETAFETKPHLRLEDLTYTDINHYVASRFRHNPEFPKLQAREPKFANQLIGTSSPKPPEYFSGFIWL
ncbi:MAG: hypothetical protein Q9160_003620 [Pyrenula sp. 1 TL-2023]